MFHFCENMYMTDSIKPNINRIKFKLYSGIGTLGVCLITFSSNKEDVFDIYPASYFKQKNLRKRDFYIIGVAENKSAAMNLIADMISECMNNKNDNISVRDYFMNIIRW